MSWAASNIVDAEIDRALADWDAIIARSYVGVIDHDSFRDHSVYSICVDAVLGRNKLHIVYPHIFAVIDENVEYFAIYWCQRTYADVLRVSNGDWLTKGGSKC